MSTARITLDNPAFEGRFRNFGRGSHFIMPAQPNTQPREISDVVDRTTVVRQTSTIKPAAQRQSRSVVLQRSATVQPIIETKKRPKVSRQKALTALAIIIFAMGSGVSILGFRTNKNVEAQVQAITTKVEKEPEAAPAEQKLSDQAIGSYQVDPTHPRYIRIAKLGLFTRVTKQGLDASGAVKAPNNVHDAGWYEGSAKPGNPGAMLLDSHVSGPTTPGAFYGIKKLVEGDQIEIERGDGQKFTYKVVKSVITSAEETDMAAAMKTAAGSAQGLNLITCTGKFNAATQDYQQRIVVFAVQI